MQSVASPLDKGRNIRWPRIQSCIGNTYAGKDLPPQIAIVIENTTICPVTKAFTFQTDINKVFLEPVLS
jgi:hypothetical protein